MHGKSILPVCGYGRDIEERPPDRTKLRHRNTVRCAGGQKYELKKPRNQFLQVLPLKGSFQHHDIVHDDDTSTVISFGNVSHRAIQSKTSLRQSEDQVQQQDPEPAEEEKQPEEVQPKPIVPSSGGGAPTQNTTTTLCVYDEKIPCRKFFFYVQPIACPCPCPCTRRCRYHCTGASGSKSSYPYAGGCGLWRPAVWWCNRPRFCCHNRPRLRY
ncbi:uncharacterized protein LOC115634004 [Scaptodrosophila lebanonensis]|uniref:Uncharacterized protein LOC115634004 n=1 Tax=Drosophila lebanonensis TaxID=7225 RepID=A0A6J2UIR0_DROLE|nr:uncharacterized protein LOC115634004 [Scaptodrosophila lebanonensis]